MGRHRYRPRLRHSRSERRQCSPTHRSFFSGWEWTSRRDSRSMPWRRAPKLRRPNAPVVAQALATVNDPARALRVALAAIDKAGIRRGRSASNRISDPARRRTGRGVASQRSRSGARRRVDTAGVELESARRVSSVGSARTDATDAECRSVDCRDPEVSALEHGAVVRSRRESRVGNGAPGVELEAKHAAGARACGVQRGRVARDALARPAGYRGRGAPSRNGFLSPRRATTSASSCATQPSIAPYMVAAWWRPRNGVCTQSQ